MARLGAVTSPPTPARSGRRGVLVVLCVVVALGGCGSSKAKPATSVLDGTPRRPSAAGVVTAVTLTEISLDGGRPLHLSRRLEAFSGLDGAPLAVLGTQGAYVQVGVVAGDVRWLGSLGPPIGTPSVVVVRGHVHAVEPGAFILDGGLVIAADPSITSRTPVGSRAELTVGVASGVVEQAVLLKG